MRLRNVRVTYEDIAWFLKETKLMYARRVELRVDYVELGRVDAGNYEGTASDAGADMLLIATNSQWVQTSVDVTLLRLLLITAVQLLSRTCDFQRNEKSRLAILLAYGDTLKAEMRGI
jgi:hypothetical protein